MRDIHRLERLVLDAIEQTPAPALADVIAYVAKRRRVWLWTRAGIVLALLRLEGRGGIEARRQSHGNGKVRWIYVRRVDDLEAPQCRACRALDRQEPCTSTRSSSQG